MSLVLLFTFSCIPKDFTTAPTMAPGANIHMRNTFDSDPSMHIGKFLPNDESILDESQGQQLACSVHVQHRYIEASGVRYSEWASITAEAAIRMGFPMIATATGSGSSNQMVHVEYDLTGKIVAEVKDPVAFSKCCETNPKQCTSNYIGEFLQGTGRITAAHDTTADAFGHMTIPKLMVGSNGGYESEWGRSVEFNKPTYFAFKSARSPLLSVTENNCGDWLNTPPTSDEGVYIVGTSRLLSSEKSARYWAQQDAWIQAQAIIGAKVSALEIQSVELQAAIQSGKVMTHAQIQQHISDEARRDKVIEQLRLEMGETLAQSQSQKWCVSIDESKKSPKYKAAVLLYIPYLKNKLPFVMKGEGPLLHEALETVTESINNEGR